MYMQIQYFYGNDAISGENSPLCSPLFVFKLSLVAKAVKTKLRVEEGFRQPSHCLLKLQHHQFFW